MKRSKNIRLFLLGGLSSVALTGCHEKPTISAQNYYTNNFYVPGAGYYHAPFRTWYPLPYNHFDPVRQLYFYGGQWGGQPCDSITNISAPLPAAVTVAENTRTDVTRGGFGSSYGGYSSGGYYGGWGFHS
ncbi:MAG TPA: hypothetical protein VG347_13075 [Verrucomicrobiae bacterium]|nr:hypothetical protein [Verrucomicrobiae bacterium]